MKTNKGFTIIELIIAIALASVLMLVSASMLIKVFSGSNQNVLSLNNVDQATAVASRFTNDLRNVANGADGSFPIVLAQDNQIIFYSNFGQNPAPLRIRYFFIDNSLFKGIVVPSGVPLSYNFGNETITKIQSDVVNESPVFYYYDGDYNGLGQSLQQPVNVNVIKYVKMELTILKQTENDSEAVFSVSAGGALRNLKSNLGE